ncbi:hypothetical protein MPTK1_8g14870 [Marchantia polymorpha subsp. ruderalis]|uniref:DUF4378 domain-containing protein n=1 Tax=Marchantia polymorpha TaxID=3197 RepID=A0A2R6W507_MARPO|nr:hypothetical protein MARPO_0151s0019 [Marchantia polymorpha]BBN19918.1 hypothetical protein Mp_8g14870 [Marchantia polymorpha subsp. ruderalis]|eukprot:PTQ28946.1 hypothetical protein MARPO_0151s0019 [Marchantia polymorpha]
MRKSGFMSRKALSEPTFSLDRNRAFSGILRRPGNIHDIDWNSLLLGKKVPTDQELADAGLEAPRNSLESSPGNRTPIFSGGVVHEEIPYGFEISNRTNMSRHIISSAELSASYHHSRSSGESSSRRKSGGEVLPIKTLIAQDSSEAEYERKRRSAPSVVARLMGLETLPQGDKAAKPCSAAKPPKPSRSQQKRSSSSTTSSHHHHQHQQQQQQQQSSKGESSSGRAESPLEDVDTIRDFPLPRSSQAIEPEITEEKAKFDKLPFRSHPQEKQLQEFKKEFMAKLANQRHEAPQAAFDRELEERRRQLREKVCEAKIALLSGGDDSRRLSSAQEKLIESKEFQDAIELLQSNREFFLKFFQEPNSVFNKDPPEPESTSSRRSFHLEDYSRDSRRAREFDESSREGSRKSFHFGDLSRESRKSYLLDDPAKDSTSRKSFHLDELSRESRRLLLHESPRRSFHLDDLSRDSKRSSSHHNNNHHHHHHIEDFAKEIRALEDYSDSHTVGSHRHHQHQHQHQQQGSSEHSKRKESSRHKHSAQASKPQAEDGLLHHKSRLDIVDKEPSLWAVVPDEGRNVSPNNYDSRKGCHSPSRIVVLKPGPGDITLLSPAMAPACSPRSYRIVRDGRGGVFEAREIGRDSMDRGARQQQQQQADWDIHREDSRFAKDRALEGYRDPRAIAKDIVREAKTSITREISRDREIGRRDPPRVGDVSLVRSSRSSGKRISSPKSEIHDAGAFEAVGSFTLAALSRRHVKDEHRSTSPTVPTPSPRIRSQETATTSTSTSSGGASSQKEWKRRSSSSSSDKHGSAAVYQVEQIEEQLLQQQQKQQGKGASPAARNPSSQVDINRASISRPAAFPPSSKSHHRSRGDPFLESQLHPDDWKGVDVNMYSTLPSSEKILKVEKVESFHSAVSAHGLADEGRDSSPPRTLARNRSVPNAAVVGSKAREVAVRPSGSAVSRAFEVAPERVENSDHFYLKEKRNEARAAYLLSKKRLGADSSSTSGRALEAPWSPIQSSSANEERTVVQDVHTVSCKQIEPIGPALDQEQHLSLTARSSLENAVAVEDLPRSGVRDCEQELLAALAQLTPKAKDNSEAGQFRKPTGHTLHDVQVGKQGSKNSKSWMLATDTLENGDGDGASETSVEKCGQPSPVSVLDSPFEAEIPSPVEFKELTSDLHDLRLRLRLLKMDESERSSALLESLQAKEKLIFQLNHKGVRHTENCLESTEGTSTSSAAVGRDVKSPLAIKSLALQYRLESVSVDGLPCPDGRRADLLYVRNLLVASGFTESSTMIIARWNSPLYPLDPCLYDRLEEYYNDVSHVEKESSKIKARGAAASAPTENMDSTNRKLLFDVVNEVIHKLLGPRLSYRPWVQPSTPLLRPIPTSRQLLSDIWTEICACFSPDGLEEFEALDALMARDVSRGGSWINSREVAEQIGLELERSIFDSLVEEAVLCLASLNHRPSSAPPVKAPSSTMYGPQSWRLH